MSCSNLEQENVEIEEFSRDYLEDTSISENNLPLVIS